MSHIRNFEGAMLKVIFSRLARLLLVAIAGLSLLLGSVACSTTTPDELPQLESVTDSLKKPQDRTTTDAASVEAAEDTLETVSDTTTKAAKTLPKRRQRPLRKPLKRRLRK